MLLSAFHKLQLQALAGRADRWTALPCFSMLQCLHTSPSPQLAGPDAPSTSSQASSTTPSASPLRNLTEQLSQLSPGGPEQAKQALATRTRTWAWYDDRDEKEWQKRELARQYTDAGYAHMRQIPTSMKKMDRILRVVRGLKLDEAMRQLKVLPHKAARYTEQMLDHAADDAEEKGLDESKLVVDTIYATKGTNYKNKGYKGKGHATILISRTCHARVLLRELPVPYEGFKTHVLPPITYAPALPPRQPAPEEQQVSKAVESLPALAGAQRLPAGLTRTAAGKVISKRRAL